MSLHKTSNPSQGLVGLENQDTVPEKYIYHYENVMNRWRIENWSISKGNKLFEMTCHIKFTKMIFNRYAPDLIKYNQDIQQDCNLWINYLCAINDKCILYWRRKIMKWIELYLYTLKLTNTFTFQLGNSAKHHSTMKIKVHV